MKYLVLLLLVACVPKEVPVIYLPPEMMGENAGITACTDNHFIIIAINYPFKGTDVEKRILSHEYVHVRQIRSLGGCEKAVQAVQKNPELKVRQEMEAYCLDLQGMVARKENIELMYETLKREFPVRYGMPFSCKEVPYEKGLSNHDGVL